jgi:hypothetical protein
MKFDDDKAKPEQQKKFFRFFPSRRQLCSILTEEKN